MNLKNILRPFIILLKINAGLAFTPEEKAFAKSCKDFAESVLKIRAVNDTMQTAFSMHEPPSYPFEIIDNPNTESIPTMCQTIDTICVPGANPALLVLGGFMYKLFSMLSPQDAPHYLERCFVLYELATTNKNISAIEDPNQRNLCSILKQRRLTAEEEANYIETIRCLSGFEALKQYIDSETNRAQIIAFDASARQLLRAPLNWAGYEANKATLVLANLRVVRLDTFAPFITTIMGNYRPNCPISSGGTCLSLMYACRELHKRNFPGQI